MDEIKINVGGRKEVAGGLGEGNKNSPSAESSSLSKQGLGENLAADDRSKSGPFFGRAIKIGIYILAFLMPLFFLPLTSSVLEINKQLLLFIFSFVLIVLWLAKVLAERKLEIKKSVLNILVFLFVIFVLVSCLLAKNTFAAFLGFGSVISESFLVVGCLALLYFLVSNTLTTKKDVDRLLFVLTGSVILAGFFGLFQLNSSFLFSWDFAKSVGFNTVGSVNALEIILAMALVLSVIMFTDSKRSVRQLTFFASVSVMLLFMLILLNFANVWRALIVVTIVVIGFGIMRRMRVNQTRLVLAMVVLAMALLFTLTKINLAGSWLKVPTEVSPTLSATFNIDRGALGDNLFFGSGPGTFSHNWELYRSEQVNQTIFWNVRFTQGISKMFSLPAILGLAGSAFWLILILFFAIWGAIKLVFSEGERWTQAFAFYSAWLFLAVMQFLYVTNLTLEFLFWLCLAVSFSLLKGLKDQNKEIGQEVVSLSFRRESPLASVFSFLLVVFMVLTISFFYLGFNYCRADILFQQGIKSANAQDLVKSREELVKAISLNPYSDNYLSAFSQVAVLQLNQELSKPQPNERDAAARQLIVEAVNISKEATDLNPQNPDNWIQRGTIYRSVVGSFPGADKWMVDSFIEVVKLQPKNPYAYFELGRSYAYLSEFNLAQAGQDKTNQETAAENLNKAEEQFLKAIEVKSDYAPAHYQMALIYDRRGNIDSAIEKMEITKVAYPNDTGLAFQSGLLYYKKQNFSQAKIEFERAVALDNNYSNARYFLGLIYDREGANEKSKEQFAKILLANPDNQEVKKIIGNLDAGKGALDGIVPPGPAPEQRGQAPVNEKQQVTR